MIGGHEAAYKAEAVAKAIFTKTSRLLKRFGFKEFIQTHYELLGAESSKSRKLRSNRHELTDIFRLRRQQSRSWHARSYFAPCCHAQRTQSVVVVSPWIRAFSYLHGPGYYWLRKLHPNHNDGNTLTHARVYRAVAVRDPSLLWPIDRVWSTVLVFPSLYWYDSRLVLASCTH